LIPITLFWIASPAHFISSFPDFTEIKGEKQEFYQEIERNSHR